MWYYSLLGKSLGPINDDEFEKLVADGTITPDTAVWNETMTDWKTYREVFPDGGASAAPVASASPEPAAAAQPVLEDKPIDEFIHPSQAAAAATPAPAAEPAPTPAVAPEPEPSPARSASPVLAEPASASASREYPEPTPVAQTAAVSPYAPKSPQPQGTQSYQPQAHTHTHGAQPGGTAAAGGMVSLNPAFNPIAPAAAPAVFCVECRRSFLESDVVRIKGQPVCAACKPAYMQKLKEGMITPGMGHLQLAHPLNRVLARLIDTLILFVLFVVIMIPAVVTAVLVDKNEKLAWVMVLVFIVTYGLALFTSFAYVVYFTVAWGGTPGKFVLGMKVVTPDGVQLGWGRSIGRFFANMVTDMTCLIGYLWCFFDEQKRTLHDIICDTRVIKQ
ncbi:hypothetical protein DB346_19945 [Verrucomicrobia bacterium LW23]|nr:hypothetical protein DB346_19945 [Verrucomicrobia bacterium LW23]